MGLLLTLASAGLPLHASDRWISLTTAHFEMYTTNSAKQGTDALKIFEQVRSFFLETSPSKKAPDTPVRIIAFKSEKQYAPYRVNEGSFAYYQRSRKRDYIVMQDVSAEHHRVAVHEYTHLVVEHSGLKLPVWLNEGLADLYSSLEPVSGGRAMVGRPLPEHQGVLAQTRWLDLGTLTHVTPDSPYYNEREKMSIFYAESWALTHMLTLGPQYRMGFPQFLLAVAAGQSADAAFLKVYGKNVKQVADDLGKYLRQNTVQASIFDIKLEKQYLEPTVADLPPLKTDLALADLLASHQRTAQEAKSRLSRLAQQEPHNPEIEESLGYLAWEARDVEAAQRHFRAAYDNNSSDPDMLYHYTSLLPE
jgi:hypothetical protein